MSKTDAKLKKQKKTEPSVKDIPDELVKDILRAYTRKKNDGELNSNLKVDYGEKMKLIANDLLEEKRKYQNFDHSRIVGPFVSRVINTQRTRYRNCLNKKQKGSGLHANSTTYNCWEEASSAFSSDKEFSSTTRETTVAVRSFDYISPIETWSDNLDSQEVLEKDVAEAYAPVPNNDQNNIFSANPNTIVANPNNIVANSSNISFNYSPAEKRKAADQESRKRKKTLEDSTLNMHGNLESMAEVLLFKLVY